MSESYTVVAGNAHYGPFETREQAVAWADHPDRTFVAFRVEPLFGGLITGERERALAPLLALAEALDREGRQVIFAYRAADRIREAAEVPVRLEVEVRDTCPECDGSGGVYPPGDPFDRSARKVTCPTCGGIGEVRS